VSPGNSPNSKKPSGVPAAKKPKKETNPSTLNEKHTVLLIQEVAVAGADSKDKIVNAFLALPTIANAKEKAPPKRQVALRIDEIATKTKDKDKLNETKLSWKINNDFAWNLTQETVDALNVGLTERKVAAKNFYKVTAKPTEEELAAIAAAATGAVISGINYVAASYKVGSYTPEKGKPKAARTAFAHWCTANRKGVKALMGDAANDKKVS